LPGAEFFRSLFQPTRRSPFEVERGSAIPAL
jgi:hypothetical protein